MYVAIMEGQGGPPPSPPHTSLLLLKSVVLSGELESSRSNICMCRSFVQHSGTWILASDRFYRFVVTFDFYGLLRKADRSKATVTEMLEQLCQFNCSNVRTCRSHKQLVANLGGFVKDTSFVSLGSPGPKF